MYTHALSMFVGRCRSRGRGHKSPASFEIYPRAHPLPLLSRWSKFGNSYLGRPQTRLVRQIRSQNQSIWPNLRARKLKFSVLNKNRFRNSSRPRAGWPVRLVLVRATPRAEVDVTARPNQSCMLP